MRLVIRTETMEVRTVNNCLTKSQDYVLLCVLLFFIFNCFVIMPMLLGPGENVFLPDTTIMTDDRHPNQFRIYEKRLLFDVISSYKSMNDDGLHARKSMTRCHVMPLCITVRSAVLGRVRTQR